jgi:NAD(P)-dependent dehydrogenase (short-subunit alcohol dehydrogenase family)
MIVARLEGRVIIVTGGAQGIGKAYCEGLAREGARVVVADIERTAQGGCIKRIETPQDLVGTIIFLCSADSDFITGQTIAVNGGTAMH